MTGWIKLHRKTTQHWIWSDPIKFQWWTRMLMEVNHSSKEILIGNNLYKIDKGQSGKSLRTWSSLFGVGTKAVINFFELLEKNDMISKKTIGKGKYSTTLITITNFQKYQDSEETLKTTLKPTQASTQEQHEGGTNNNDKKIINNDNNEKSNHFSAPTLLEVQLIISKYKYLTVDANVFWNYYESKNWYMGKFKMVDWEKAIALWESRGQNNNMKKNGINPQKESNFIGRQSESTVRSNLANWASDDDD